MNSRKKLNIKNTDKVIGINMLGISISDWISSNDDYQFLVYDSFGIKWMFKLDRFPDEKGDFLLSLILSNKVKTKKISKWHIQIKRLFYMQINELLDGSLK